MDAGYTYVSVANFAIRRGLNEPSASPVKPSGEIPDVAQRAQTHIGRKRLPVEQVKFR